MELTLDLLESKHQLKQMLMRIRQKTLRKRINFRKNLKRLGVSAKPNLV
jgi:hypothetical protein